MRQFFNYCIEIPIDYLRTSLGKRQENKQRYFKYYIKIFQRYFKAKLKLGVEIFQIKFETILKIF